VRRRQYASQKLKGALSRNADAVNKDIKYQVYISSSDTHVNHVVGDHCRLFISVFFRSSNLVKFVARYGVMSGRCKSTLGSNIHSCVSRFKFNQWAFFDGCVNADNVIREHCFSLARLIPFWRSLVHARINNST